MPSNERFGKLARRKAQLEARAVLFADIVGGLTNEQGAFVEHVGLDGPHHQFGSEATLLLKVASRGDAVAVLGLFPPQALEMAYLVVGGQAVILADVQIRTHARAAILPFTYTCTQTRKVARHTLTWVCKLANRVQVTVECDIASDLAAFTFEHVDDVAHNQVLFRRVPNPYLPDGPRINVRGLEWSTVKDAPASVTVWWPYNHEKFVSNLNLTFFELALIALEARQEAHVHETQG